MSRSKRITQPEAIFYKLYMNRAEGGNAYIPVWQFIGEVFIAELGRWAFISYEATARLSEMWSENPGFLDREKRPGKSGGRKYYHYRIHPQATSELIRDPELKAFFKLIQTHRQMQKVVG